MSTSEKFNESSLSKHRFVIWPMKLLCTGYQSSSGWVFLELLKTKKKKKKKQKNQILKKRGCKNLPKLSHAIFITENDINRINMVRNFYINIFYAYINILPKLLTFYNGVWPKFIA